MSDLISELAALLVQDNAVLFVGAAWRQEQRPLLQAIAEALAAAMDYRGTDRTLPAIARDFELERGRQALIQTVREVVERQTTALTPLHQVIADVVLPMSKVITTRFDRTLEQALERAGKPYVLIIRDTDLPFFDESKVTLIKMQGDITQPDSLVITEDDIEAFLERLPTLSDVVRAFFATKTLIFLGYDLESAQFKRFYKLVTRRLSAYRRPAYAVTGAPLEPREARYWERENVRLVAEDPEVFLRRLAAAVAALAPAGRAPAAATPTAVPIPAALPAQPYKGLTPFAADDALIFIGRQDETRRLTNRILAHRLTVLYGEAGVGKTSLLRAGVAPLLAQQDGHLLIVTPTPDVSPETAVRKALSGLVPASTTETVPDLIRVWQQQRRGPLVLAFDPGEDLMALAAAQASVVSWLQTLAADLDLNLRMVLVVRDEALGRLENLQAVWPGVLDVRFRLERLGREAARAAIEEPSHRFGVRWEAGLVERLLDDLDRGGVMPPLLQLVCARLYERATADRDPTTGLVIPAGLYDALGGVEGILGDHLESIVAALPAEQRDLGRQVLATLVAVGDTAGRGQGLTVAELMEVVPGEADTLRAILDTFALHRLVRRGATVANENAPQTTYELAHESLAPRILQWWGESFWQTQRAYAVMRQALAMWQQRGRLPAPADLRLVHAHRRQLRLNPTALALFYTAAVTYDLDPAAWATMLEPAAQRDALLRLASDPEPATRARACGHLAAFADAEVAATLADRALTDPDASVRQAAATAIAEGLRAHGDPQALTALVTAVTDSVHQDAALAALTLARDRAPAAARHLPPSLARTLQRRVWAVRWRRQQPRILAATVAGAQGGFWGLGLGFGLVLGLSSAAVFGGVVDTRRLVGLLLTGLAMGGVIGALVGGGAAFARATLTALEDGARPRRTWFVATAVAALMFGLGLVVLNFGAAGPLLPGRMLAAGLLVGSVLAGSALWSQHLPVGMRAGLTTLLGVLAFPAVRGLGLAFVQAEWPWLIALGGTAGLGLFLGLGREGPAEAS
ncbi:MAG: SIR2 family protein [Caldilineales bacterium]|nr:SIR2 family protein [Caldilineales bacterium]